jgi:polysaccharide chain length determinant protein (PEP-CTERM system associated)
MTDPATSVEETLRILLREGRQRVLLLAAIFSVVALGVLALGLTLPKKYEAHSIVLVESKNVLTPLMEGRAISTGVSDEASIVSQTLLSRRNLREIMLFGGFGDPKDPRAEEQLLSKIAGRIKISSMRLDLVRLSYADTDPQRCYVVAQKLTEMYIRESVGGKERESREAFEFIDRQVKEYGQKLSEAHAEVLAHPGVGARLRSASAPRVVAPRPRVSRASSEELAALYAEEASLAAELDAVDRPTQQRTERVQQLQRELDSLLTQFTEQHPTVKRAREQLAAARADADGAARSTGGGAGATTKRARLAAVRRQIVALNGAPQAPDLFEPPTELSPELRGVSQDSQLSELIRRYEATRDVYQDLLKRRENSRVTMELDMAHRGRTVRVYEAPEVPVIATGLRLLHFVLFGLALAAAAPLGLLLAIVRFDPRIRSATQLQRAGLVPFLVAIPLAPSPSETRRRRRRVLVAGAMVAGVFAAYGAAFVIKVKMGS